MNISDFILIVFSIVIAPFIVGKITNFVFKIKDNDDASNVWYTGVWVSFILLAIFSVLWSVIKQF
jgi:hypothetical protein